MKTLLTTSILVIITHLISFPTGVVLVIMSFMKGLRCDGFKETFNVDMKFHRLYKNDLYEFISVMIIIAVMYDGFHPSSFVEPLDIPVTIIQILILFFYCFVGWKKSYLIKKSCRL